MLMEVELEVDVDVEKRRPVTRRPVTNKLQVNRPHQAARPVTNKLQVNRPHQAALSKNLIKPTRYIKANKIHSQ
jgi:hypothetical protein